MNNLSKLINNASLLTIESSESLLDRDANFLISGEGSYNIEVGEGVSTQLIVVNGAQSSVDINIRQGAKLKLVEFNQDCACSKVKVSQHEGSELNLLSIQLNSSKSDKFIDLIGENALCKLNTLDMISSDEQSYSNIIVKHSVAKCESAVQSKILVSGSSKTELKVRAIVVEGAQQSVANQSLRSIELNDGARAKVWPELEIYADDVKCSHGATMGQIDSEAILYMRQRGLSLEQARQLQMKGFIADVVSSVSIESVDEIIEEAINMKFNTL
ncbi:MAG: SufD family Fe-S cluster assembly protein [Rikenellaceae bacterium]